MQNLRRPSLPCLLGRFRVATPLLPLVAGWLVLNLVACVAMSRLGADLRTRSDRSVAIAAAWEQLRQASHDGRDKSWLESPGGQKFQATLTHQLQQAQRQQAPGPQAQPALDAGPAGAASLAQIAFWGQWSLFSQLLLVPLGAIWAVWRISRGIRGSISHVSNGLDNISSSLAGQVARVALPTCPPGDTFSVLERQTQHIAARIPDVVAQLQAARHDVIRNARLAAVGELAAGLAHELRNPLTSVNLLVHSLGTRGADDAVDRRKLQVVHEEIQRMDRTIRSLLDFARPTATHRIRHDLREVVDRALFLVQARAQQRGVQLSQQIPSEPAWVQADPDQLHQVFVNLLLNGIDAMEGGGELTVALEGGEGNSPPTESKNYRIRVSDTGRGIPPEILDRIFEPFVTGKEHGTGLGLAISRRIVEEHGGRLTASNRPQSGAMFTVELKS